MNNIKQYNKLKIEYKRIINTRKRIDKNLKFKVDKEKAYEWLFLYSVTLFENYLETIFLSLLKHKLKIKNRSWIKLKKDIIFSANITDKNIKKFILWDKWWEYLDWLPYKNKTKERSKIFFLDWKPFTCLDSWNEDILNQIIKIRNFIAHKSIESKKKIEKLYSFKLLSIYFLFNKPHSNWNNYFDNFILELSSISWNLQNNIIEK